MAVDWTGVLELLPGVVKPWQTKSPGGKVCGWWEQVKVRSHLSSRNPVDTKGSWCGSVYQVAPHIQEAHVCGGCGIGTLHRQHMLAHELCR